MDDAATKLEKVLRQQAAIAGFGSFALRQSDLLKVLTEAARVCADGLSVPFSKICRYRAEENDLLIEAGHGWHEGVVGHVVSRADKSSPQGRAFITGEPSICNDVGKDNNFELPAFYAAHGIISTIDVIIKGSDDQPWGVLEIDNDQQHDYDQQDIIYLTGFANVLAEAVATSRRTDALRASIEQMKTLVEDKDRLLDQKAVLAEELQHRVRNNLQLVQGMLSKQLEDTTDKTGQKGIKAIARRVSTLAQVYDHLLGSDMTRTTDFGRYVKSLCNSLVEIQAMPDSKIVLTCDCESIPLDLDLDLDVATMLGLVVAELVTNSYEHAFSNEKGKIGISIRRDANDNNTAVMTVADNGVGFVPTAESKRHGVGLVKRLIEQIRGNVTVKSDHGTTWIISFPIVSVIAQAG